MVGCPTLLVYGNMGSDSDVIDIASQCNMDCECPMARLQPVCSKDGVTNFYSPCQAGCRATSQFIPKVDPSQEVEDNVGKPITVSREQRYCRLKDKNNLKYVPAKVYEDCSCVLESWYATNNTLSEQWIQNDYLSEYDPTDALIKKIGQQVSDQPIDEAFSGWCPGDCDAAFKTWLLCMFVLMILSAAGIYMPTDILVYIYIYIYIYLIL